MDEVDLSGVLDDFLAILLRKRYRILKVGRYVLTIQGMSIFMILFVLCIIGGTIWIGYVPESQRRGETTLTREDVVTLETKLAELEAQLNTIKTTDQTDQLDRLEAELREIRLAISGDPERVLTLQRMNFDILRVESRIDTLETLTKWIFGVTLALAVGVMTALFRAVLRPSPPPKE